MFVSISSTSSFDENTCNAEWRKKCNTFSTQTLFSRILTGAPCAHACCNQIYATDQSAPYKLLSNILNVHHIAHAFCQHIHIERTLHQPFSNVLNANIIHCTSRYIPISNTLNGQTYTTLLIALFAVCKYQISRVVYRL